MCGRNIGYNAQVWLNHRAQLGHLTRLINTCLNHRKIMLIRIESKQRHRHADAVIPIASGRMRTALAQQHAQHLLGRSLPATTSDTDDRRNETLTHTSTDCSHSYQ